MRSTRWRIPGTGTMALLCLGAALVCGCGGKGTPEQKKAARVMARLDDTKPETRLNAAVELGRLRHRPAWRRLVGLLGDVRMDVRAAAAEALGEIGEPGAVEHLAAAVDAPNWAVRKAVIDALGKIGTPETVPVLAPALADENPAIGMAAAGGLLRAGEAGARALLSAATNAVPRARAAVAYGLEKLESSEALDKLRGLLGDKSPSVRLAALESLAARGGTGEIELLAGMVADEEPAIRKRAAEMTLRAGPSALPFLIKAAQHENKFARLQAVRALAQSGSEAAVQPLLLAMGDGDANVRSAAEAGVAGMKSRPEIRRLLLSSLRGDSPAIRLGAMKLIEPDGGKDLAAASAPLLADPSREIRLLAARAVCRDGDKAALDGLVPLLKDKDPSVRQVAAAGLIERGDPRAADALIEGLKHNAEKGGKTLKEEELILSLRMLGQAKDARVFEYAAALLTNRSESVCTAAADTLGAIGDKRAIDPLRAVVAGGPTSVAIAAGGALAKVQGDDATGIIAERMKKEFEAIGGYKGGWRDTWRVERWFPVFTNLCNPRAVDALAPMLRYHGGPHSESPGVFNHQKCHAGIAAQTAEILAEMGDPRAFDAVLERLRESVRVDNRYEPRARRPLARALIKLDRGRAAGAIAEILAKEHNHREGLLIDYMEMLRELGDARAVPAIAARLASDSKDVKEAARKALTQFGEAAIPGMIDMLDGASVGERSEVAAMLASMGDPAIAALTAAAEKGSEKAKQCAAWAFGQMNDKRAVAPMVKAVKDESPRVRAAAAWALGQLRAADGVEPLIGLLKNETDELARRAAARALGEIGDKRATEVLAGALAETNVVIRGVAVLSLGQIGGEQAAEAVRELLESEQNQDVRDAATVALRMIEGGRKEQTTGKDAEI